MTPAGRWNRIVAAFYKSNLSLSGGSVMFVIRNVFLCKPGQAKNVIDKFKAVQPLMQDFAKHTIMVDEVASFWTVVVQVETEDLATFQKMLHERGSDTRIQDAMSGYMDFVESGYREIFRVVA